ncbi:C-type lectin domain family 5 member A-like isoform X2 [Sphaerodactylus townsendi]|uniref:Uncharacterized protein n=2 Tax=Sphaerodactylus townsendi TaxID=933632 RepID=A0ACB8ES87_9SAUR|nr:C-type lectin domain family 5 member A-like isoform X2 [Sphaerodactylus townsendi]XP_048359849.1 C-type lectin domain family 5 member A-like isoform X2 [Sphaerodactylus townsendi]XP_048359850.1 C-type lectin domain family 5 member A-like isoform X2 [Sphaerodactylus townsendi]XP_048359851.1 C-type lectin domain family 5 member A-like isoform X2 [Sphaerodactylus townsendi]
MGWQYVAPGIFLLLVKLTGTSLFIVFFPQIFPRGNFSFVPEENDTVLQTPPSPTISPTRITTTAAVLSPQLRWESYEGNLYGFSEDMLEWSSSYYECEDHQSTLVIINDKREMEFLQNETRNGNYYIGLQHTDDGNKWIWLDNTELNGNVFTISSTDVEQQCAALRGKKVSPVSCYQKNRWICEKKNG